MRKAIALMIALLMVIGSASAEMIRTDDSTMFAQGIELLRQVNDQRSVKAAEDVFANIASGYNCSSYFKMYARALSDLHEGKYSNALMRLEILEGNKTFAALLKQYSLPICEAIRIYTEGRQAEDEGRYDDASELYAQTDIMDSLDRIFTLKSKATELTYERAVALFDDAEYAEAAELFTSLGNYLDSADRARQATALIPTPEPTPMPSPTPSPTPEPTSSPTPKPLPLTKTILYGRYEQDGNTENGPESIEWMIAGEENNNILLISKYSIDYLPYQTTDMEGMVTFDLCDWLNTDFKVAAFTGEEQAKLINDKVILLNQDQYVLYMASEGRVFLTASAIENRFGITKSEHYQNPDEWWLMDSCAVFSPNEWHWSVDREPKGVRPCIWLPAGII